MPNLPKDTQWLKAMVAGRPIAVDREANVLRGYVVAQEGPFKTPGRGKFDSHSLDTIQRLMGESRGGLKSRFTHPSLSGDGLGKFLGRARDTFRDGNKLRADLYFDRTALDTPPEGGKPLGIYLMDLAESDPAAFSSSLVLNTEKVYELDEKGRYKKDEKGDELPPLWKPTRLHASDIVDTGDAVDDVMSATGLAEGFLDGLPDAIARRGCELLDEQFAGSSAEAIRARCNAWLERYLALRFDPAAGGSPESAAPAVETGSVYPDLDLLRRKSRLKELGGL